MSSILDALKKIEEESVHASGLRPRIRQEAGAGDRIRFFLIDRALVLFFAVGLIGLGAGGFWAYATFYNTPAKNQIAAVAVSSPVKQATAERPSGLPPAQSVAQPSVRSSGKSDAVAAAQPHPEKTARTATPVAQPAPAAADKPAPPAPLLEKPAPATPPVVAGAEPAPGLPAERHTPEKAPERMVRSEPPPQTAAVMDSVPVLEDSSLTLQAISWAARPENRIAVINGRICREGEKIDGFVLRQINPDDIRIADGKNTWRLEFNIK